jgi:hypothetical protein
MFPRLSLIAWRYTCTLSNLGSKWQRSCLHAATLMPSSHWMRRQNCSQKQAGRDSWEKNPFLPGTEPWSGPWIFNWLRHPARVYLLLYNLVQLVAGQQCPVLLAVVVSSRENVLLQWRRYRMDDPGVRFPAVARYFSLLQNVQTSLGPTQPPRQWVPQFLPRGQSDRACTSPSSSFRAQVSNECSYTSTSPIRLHGVPKNNRTFALSLRLSCRNDNHWHELKNYGNKFWELDLLLYPAFSNQEPSFAGSHLKSAKWIPGIATGHILNEL